MEEFSLLEKLKFELTDNFINFRTGEIKEGYTPLTLAECKSVIAKLTYQQAKGIFPDHKIFLDTVDKELKGANEHTIAMHEVAYHLKKIKINTTFNLCVQSAIDDVDEFSATKLDEDKYDISIPYRGCDKKLGYVQIKEHLGIVSHQEIISYISKAMYLPFTNILFRNDGVATDLAGAIKLAIAQEYYSVSRDYQLYIDILIKKHPKQKDIISTLIQDYIKNSISSMIAAKGFEKLWKMYMEQ